MSNPLEGTLGICYVLLLITVIPALFHVAVKEIVNDEKEWLLSALLRSGLSFLKTGFLTFWMYIIVASIFLMDPSATLMNKYSLQEINAVITSDASNIEIAFAGMLAGGLIMSLISLVLSIFMSGISPLLQSWNKSLGEIFLFIIRFPKMILMNEKIKKLIEKHPFFFVFGTIIFTMVSMNILMSPVISFFRDAAPMEIFVLVDGLLNMFFMVLGVFPWLIYEKNIEKVASKK